MTQSDIYRAVTRYCERLERSNCKPGRITQIRSVLHDFLREVNQDMETHPGLFTEPHWGWPHSPPLALPTLNTRLDCVGGPGGKVSLPERGDS